MMSAQTILDFSYDEFFADPWPVYKALRKTDPVHWSETFRAFLFTRSSDVVDLLGDRRVTSGFPMRSSRRLFGPNVLDSDGDDHRQMRKMLTPTLGRSSVDRLRTEILVPAVDEVLDSIAAELGSADELNIDFMARVAVRVPYAMITRLLGLPPEDAAWLRERVLPLAGAMEFPASSSSLAMALAAKAELIAYLKKAIDKRRPGGAATFLDFLCPPNEPVDESSLAFATLFMLGATETSVATIGKVMYALLAHDIELSALADAEYRNQVIRETLRWEPPTHTIVRYSSTNMTIHGVDIPRRSTLLLSLGSASRDEALFSDPDKWRPGRSDQRLLAFSAGPHTCLGAQLAFAEFDTLFECLSLRFAGVRRTDVLEDVRAGLWRLRERGHIFRQPDQLHVQVLSRHSERSAMHV